MVLADDGKIRQVVGAVVVKSMGVAHWTIVYVACFHFFYSPIIFEMTFATEDEDDF